MKNWSNERELQLLRIYRREPVLWDPKHRYNKDRYEINEAWNRISEELGIPVPDLKRKKDSLMATYRTHRRRIKASEGIGSRGADVYKPIWFAFDLMNSFLGEASASQTTNNIATQVQDRNDVEVKQERPETPIDPLSTDNGHVPESTRVKTVNHIRRRRTPQELTEAGHTLNAALGTLNKVLLQQGKKHEQEKDECDLYGELLAKKLRRLPYNERLSLMHEIDGMFIRRLSENTTVLEVSPSLSAHQVRPGSASSYSEAMAVDPLSSAASLYSEPMDRQ